MGLSIYYLSPLSDMSPAASDCLEPYFSVVIIARVCPLCVCVCVCVDFSGSFISL